MTLLSILYVQEVGSAIYKVELDQRAADWDNFTMFSRCVYLVRSSAAVKTCRLPQVAGYKSQYSLDKLFPQSNFNYTADSIVLKVRNGVKSVYYRPTTCECYSVICTF